MSGMERVQIEEERISFEYRTTGDPPGSFHLPPSLRCCARLLRVEQ